ARRLWGCWTVSAADELIERIRLRLLPDPQAAEETASLVPDWMPDGGFSSPRRDAAVLIALVRRGEAVLREASEEVGLDPADARLLGYMPAYFTGSNYLITPVVAEVRPGHDFVGNPGEV